MQIVSRPRAARLNLSDATRRKIRDIALVGALFLAAFSATIVLRVAIALALIADGYAR